MQSLRSNAHVYAEQFPSMWHLIKNRLMIQIFAVEFDILHDSRAATHWGRVTHICVGNLTIIGSDNGLSPGRRQTIIWTNAGILLIGPWETNFSEILISIHTFSFKKIHLKISSAKWRPFCLGLNVLNIMTTGSLLSNMRLLCQLRCKGLYTIQRVWIGDALTLVDTIPKRLYSLWRYIRGVCAGRRAKW